MDILVKATIEGLGGTYRLNTKTGVATVTLNNKTAQVYVGDGNGTWLSNGSMVTDDYWLFTALGFFTTENGAVCDFANNWNPTSIENNWEYGTFIFKVTTNGANSYEVPGQLGNTWFSYYDPWTDKSKDSIGISMSYHTNKNFELVAWAHTHGAYKSGYDNENFSGTPGDKNVSIGFSLNAYVVTPGGQIKKYDYQTKNTMTLKHTTYHDHRSQLNFWWRAHRCANCAN